MTEELLHAARALLRLNGGGMWKPRCARWTPGPVAVRGDGTGLVSTGQQPWVALEQRINPGAVDRVARASARELVVSTTPSRGSILLEYASADELEADLVVLEALVAAALGFR